MSAFLNSLWMPALAELPLLSLLLALPLFFAGLVYWLPQAWTRPVAFLGFGSVLLLSGVLVLGYAVHGVALEQGFAWVARAVWIPSLGAQYLVGVDGLSILFLPSCALLFLMVFVRLSSSAGGGAASIRSLSALFVLESATLAIFSALDTFLFFVVWELALLPTYILLARDGVIQGAERVANRYLMVMLASGAPLLLAFLYLAQAVPSAGFDLLRLYASDIPITAQWMIFGLGLLGFSIKMPLVPFHTWLPALAMASPAAVLAVVLGLKVGVYAAIRFALPLAPAVTAQMDWLLTGLGTVSLLYGAVSMLAQSNLRPMLAYASIAHVGLVLLGLATRTEQGLVGAVSLLLSFVLASGGLVLLLDYLRSQTQSTDVAQLGGLAGPMPVLAAGVLICGLAGVGMPGTSSFPGEYLLLMSAIKTHGGAGLAALFGLAIAAGAFLHAYRRAFFGPTGVVPPARCCDVRGSDRMLLILLVVLVFGIGVFPEPWVALIRPSAADWVLLMSR